MTFAGTVYNDLNGNGVLDSGEPGLKGWTVNLIDAVTAASSPRPPAPPTVPTRSRTSARACTRSRRSTRPAGTRPSRSILRESTRSRPSAAPTRAGLNFGNFKLVNVTGEVYNDLNGNGKLDPGEPGLQGWTVMLLDPAGNTVATTTSDAQRRLRSSTTSSPARSPSKRFSRSAGPRPSRSIPNYYQFTTQSGLNETGLNFGNFLPVDVSRHGLQRPERRRPARVGRTGAE